MRGLQSTAWGVLRIERIDRSQCLHVLQNSRAVRFEQDFLGGGIFLTYYRQAAKSIGVAPLP